MKSTFADKVLTIAVTAALTSAGWVVVENSSFKWTTGETPARSGEPSGATVLTPPMPVDLAPPEVIGGLVVPVAGVAAAQLTDTFSDERDGGTRLHEALDIAAAAGTPVLAAASGTVEKLAWSDGGGNTIYIRSPDQRTIHYYAHLQNYAPGLSEGQNVRRGQKLGTVGSSGNADSGAPHLHFAILRTTPDAGWGDVATAVNPYPLLRGG